jgi:hypothetical protein
VHYRRYAIEATCTQFIYINIFLLYYFKSCTYSWLIIIYIYYILKDMVWWVRSFNPYQINLSVKDLQGLIQMGTRMSQECFNMGVRVHAYNEADRLQNTNNKIVTNHYMDSRFYVNMLLLLYSNE